MKKGRSQLVGAPAVALLLLTGAAPQADRNAETFAKTVLPLLSAHCYSCHGASPKPKADLNLTAYKTEASLRENRKLWKLVVRMLHSHEMPPKESKTPLAQEDRERLAKGVDTLLNWVDPKAPPNPGRVTVRRLNRTEYGNTIRDLMGVDFDPAEDFPSDDIGYGFDNIGDVLTLSPVLLERYLAAAEAIVQRSFPAEPPKPQDNHQAAKYLEPAGKDVPQGRFRPISTAKGDGVRTGPLYNSYRTVPDGEYLFRFRVWAKTAGTQVAVLACGKNVPSPAGDAEVAKLSGAALQSLRPFRVVETVDVKAADEKSSKPIQVKIPPTPGLERVAVALLKGPDGEAPREVSIESFVLSGPLDPRPAFQRKALAGVEGKPKAEQARQILRGLATKAFRRPVADAELARLTKMVEDAEAGGLKWEAALGLAMQAVLVSPKFLFRVELDDKPEAAEAHPLTEHQLASRLSYFLWASLPDEELAGLAAKGQLAAQLEPQVRRMLKDPKARELVDSFAVQWLQLQRISFVAPDGTLFPQFRYGLRESMLKETSLFVQAIVQEDRSVLDFLGADFTFLDERLGQLYGIVDTMGNRDNQKDKKPGGQRLQRDVFQRVQLQGGDRGGLLTQASVLTVTSNPTRTSPVKRGRWVLEQILGEPPPPPPPDVPELPEGEKAQQSGPLKKRLEQHRSDPRCANCHARMDAIGFALENYNAIGQYRWKDGAFDIDATAQFPDGTAFKGAAELRKVLLDRKELFVRCLIEKLLTYGLGRGVEPYDDPAIRKIQDAAAKDGFKFSRLLIEIVKSEPFRLRRGRNSKD